MTPGLIPALSTAALAVSLMLQENVTAHETFMAADGHVPSFVQPPDTGRFAPEKATRPKLNPPRSTMLRECAYCDREKREWYDDTAELGRMAFVCGVDYLLIRFDREYSRGATNARAAYFFSCRGETALLDSAQIMVSEGAGTRQVTYMLTGEAGHISLLSRTRSPKQISQGRKFIELAAKAASSFRSVMAVEPGDASRRYSFVVSLQGAAYFLSDGMIVSRPDTGMASASAIADPLPSYRLAYAEHLPLSCTDCTPGESPVITRADISYDDLNRLNVEVECRSPAGLKRLGFFAGPFSDTTSINDSVFSVKRALDFDTSQRELVITVTDAQGASSSVKRSIFEVQRRDGVVRREHDEKERREKAWSDRSPLNKIVWTLAHFGVGPAAMPGLSFDVFHGLLDRRIAADLRKDTLGHPPVNDIAGFTMATAVDLCTRPGPDPSHISSLITLRSASVTQWPDHRFSIVARLEPDVSISGQGTVAGRIVIHFSRSRVEPAITFSVPGPLPLPTLPASAFLSCDSVKLTKGILFVDGFPGTIPCASQVSFRTVFLSDAPSQRDSLRYLLCVNYRNRLRGDSLSMVLPSSSSSQGIRATIKPELHLSYSTSPLSGLIQSGLMCNYRLSCSRNDQVDVVNILVFASDGRCLGATTVRCPA
jgi:hypothetical protein